MRDLRTVNGTEGQKIENDLVIKRIGDISYRNLGTLSKIGTIDYGKVCIVGDGLRVEPSSNMTVNIPSGTCFQRFTDVIPCLQEDDQTVTLDAATGVGRIDIIEAQIKVASDKNDYSQVATVASGSAISVTSQLIKRDIKAYLTARKQTGTTTATAATAGTLTGTVAIAGTIDLSEKYLLNLSDGEDGSFQEIDCRGATPEATTRAEIIAAINSATGRVMASTGTGNVVVLTGIGTGQTSLFTIKTPVTDADKDCAGEVFGISVGGVYRYEYYGTNEWFKLAEIDVGAATTVITTGLIRNIDEKSTWASDGDETVTAVPALNPLSSRTAITSISDTDYVPVESSGISKASTWAYIKSNVQSQALWRTKTVTTTPYVVTNVDMSNYDEIMFDTTSNAITVTLADLASNYGKKLRLSHAIQDASLDIVTVNRAGSDTITADDLTSIELPKVGNFLELFASSVTGKYEILSESITCQIRLDGFSGYGSTDNKIMRFTNNREFCGNYFSQNHDSGYAGNTEGLEITIEKTGIYGLTFSDAPTGGTNNIGISQNSSQLTTTIMSIAINNRLCYDQALINTLCSVSIQMNFKKGDILRPHTAGSSSSNSILYVSYLGN